MPFVSKSLNYPLVPDNTGYECEILLANSMSGKLHVKRMENFSIGSILKNMRTTNTKYTQKDLGKLLSLADNTISSYERENSQPSFETIVKIAKLCDYEIKFRQESNYLNINIS